MAEVKDTIAEGANQVCDHAPAGFPEDELEEEIWKTLAPGFLKAPPKQYPMQGFRFITCSKERVKKLCVNRKTLPDQFEVDEQAINDKMNDADVFPAKLIQYSNLRQYVKIDDDLFPVTGLEISDGKNLSIIFDTKEISNKEEIKEVLSN